MARPKYEEPDYEAIFRQMRADFYRREKEPARRAVDARFRELGVKVGAGAHGHKETQ